MRECFRRSRAELRGACDVVLIGRSAIAAAPWTEIVNDFADLARRAGLRE